MSSSRSFDGRSEQKRSTSKLKAYSRPRASYEEREDTVRGRRNPRDGGNQKFVGDDGEVNRSFRSISINSSEKRRGKNEARKGQYARKSPEYSGEESYDSRRSRSRDLYRGSDSSESDFKDCQMDGRGEEWAGEGTKQRSRGRPPKESGLGKGKYKSEIRSGNTWAKGRSQCADDFGQNPGGRGNKLLGMSSRQQVKYLMQKTQQEAGWDMDNDSDLKGGSESSENENDMIKEYYSNPHMWKSTFEKRPSLASQAPGSNQISPLIKGIGGCWGLGVKDQLADDYAQNKCRGFNGQVYELDIQIRQRDLNTDESPKSNKDTLEPFFTQYEKRMEFLRNRLVQDQKYRLRMYALATLQYNPIKQNKYIERKKNVFTDRDAQTLICNCQKTKKYSKMLEPDEQSKVRKWGRKTEAIYQSLNCGRRCINRDMSFECSVLSCPAYNFCTNRHFQLFQDRLVYPIRTQFKGWGLAAGEYIPKNSFVMQYVGEIFNVDSDIGIKRIQKYKNSTCTYLMRIDNNEVIDPTTSGNVARFINHSCDPNCQTRKWTVLNEVCVGIFTLKDLQENEELTFDYQFDFFKTPFTRCYCGTAKCKGFLGVANTTNRSSSSNSASSRSSSNSEEERSSYGSDSSMQSQQSGKDDEVQSDNQRDSQTIQIALQTQHDQTKKSSKHEKEMKKQTEDQPNQERPICSFCSKEIQDSKQLIICKGPCKQISHYDCAVEQDKSLENDPSILKKRKFECRPCYRKASGQKKRGRKSKKEIMEIMMNQQNSNNEDAKDEINDKMNNTTAMTDPNRSRVTLKQPSIEEDLEVKKIKENTPTNLLFDRMIAHQVRKVEKQMQKLMKDRLQSFTKSSTLRSKKFQVQQFSDHYIFMFELIRRLKAKTKQIMDLTKTDGAGGCQIVLQRFFKEFPRIARSMSDVENIAKEGLSNECMFNKQDREEEENEEEDNRVKQRRQSLQSKSSIRNKRKYVRRKDISHVNQQSAITEQKQDLQKDVATKRRGRPKSTRKNQEPSQSPSPYGTGDKGNQINQTGIYDRQKDEQNDIDSISGKEEYEGPSNKRERIQIDMDMKPVDQESDKPENIQEDDVESESESVIDDEAMSRGECGESEQQESQQSVQDDTSGGSSLYSQNNNEQESEDQQDYISNNGSVISGDSDEDSAQQSEEGEQEIEESIQEFPKRQAEELGEDGDEIDAIMSGQERDSDDISDSESSTSKRQRASSLSSSKSKVTPQRSPVLEGLKAIQGEPRYRKQIDDKMRKDRPRKSSGRFQIRSSTQPTYGTSRAPHALFKTSSARRKKSQNQIDYDRRNRKNSEYFNQEQSKAQASKKEQKIMKEYKQLKDEIKQRWSTFVKNENAYRREQGFSKIETKPTRFNVNERVFNIVIKNHVNHIECIDGLQVFWDKPWGSNVTLKIVSSKYQFHHISTLIQYCTNKVFQIHNQFHIQDALHQFEIQKLQVPKNFIRKLVGYQEKSLSFFRMNPKYNVDFQFDEKLLVDEIFQMDEFTQLRIFGRKKDVAKVSEILLNQLEAIKMKSILIQQIDCNFVMTNVKEIKALVDPCEVRIKQNERMWKDLRHPFLYLPNYLRDIILIGTQEEIQIAERKLSGFLRLKRERENEKYTVNQQLSFVLPIFIKENIDRYKKEIYKKFGKTVQVFYYMPTFPRKHLTVSLIGPWNSLLDAKELLQEVSKGHIAKQYGNYDNFQRTVFHQQIRFAFKSLKRYILEKDIKYLSHWDIVSVFVDNIGKDFKFDFDENDIQMLIKAKQRAMKEEQSKLAAEDFQSLNLLQQNSLVQNAPPQQESFLDQLMNDDQIQPKHEIEENDLDILGEKTQNLDLSKQDSKRMLPLHMKKQESYVSVQTQDQMLVKREDVILEYQQSMEKMRKNEISELIKYIKEEDPESCINILFVLSQCKSDDQMTRTSQKDKDELNLLMDRLKIKKSSLVECMHTVLYDNLLDFFQSIGKQKHHIHQFESDRSSNQSRNEAMEAEDSDTSKAARPRYHRDRSRSRRDSKSRRQRTHDENRSRSRGRFFKTRDYVDSRQRVAQSRNSSRDLNESKRFQRRSPDANRSRYERSFRTRHDDPKAEKDSKRNKYDARYFEKFGKYRLPRDQQQAQMANKLNIKDDEDFVIQNDQQIPRYGFSRSIQRIAENQEQDENEIQHQNRFDDPEINELERNSFLNKRVRNENDLVEQENQAVEQEQCQDVINESAPEVIRNQVRNSPAGQEEQAGQDLEIGNNEIEPVPNEQSRNSNFMQENNLRRATMQIQGQGDMVGNRNSSDERLLPLDQRPIQMHVNPNHLDFAQNQHQRFQHEDEEGLMYSQYEMTNRIIQQPYDQEYERNEYIEDTRTNGFQVHQFNGYSRIERPQLMRVHSMGQPRRQERQVDIQYRQRQTYHPDSFYHQSNDQHINISDQWDYEPRLNQEEDRLQMPRMRRPQYHEAQPEIFNYESMHNQRIPSGLQTREQNIQFQREEIDYSNQIYQEQLYEGRNRPQMAYSMNFPNQQTQNQHYQADVRGYSERNFNRSPLMRFPTEPEPEFREPSLDDNHRRIQRPEPRAYNQFPYPDRRSSCEPRAQYRPANRTQERSQRDERVSRLPPARRRDFNNQSGAHELPRQPSRHHSKHYD